ncbi:hypothetical protein [Actinoplanes aureus]|uniref:Uncharacterized protein n=1 Tax=Actinoplanes aureus TaxID=2792083 RepID=A0A931CJK0_9ACTN|nr:hypothetical protein [Actinoplanes aureus]MBG0567348.1 hypothetical protein [Actinoplanes aureus]
MATTFNPTRIEDTLDKLTDAQPDSDADTAADSQIITACDRKLAGYRAVLDTGGDPAVVSEWIAQTQAEKSLAEARLRQRGSGKRRLSREQIRHIVTTLTDIIGVIHDADPADKAAIYGPARAATDLPSRKSKSAGRIKASTGVLTVCVRRGT